MFLRAECKVFSMFVLIVPQFVFRFRLYWILCICPGFWPFYCVANRLLHALTLTVVRLCCPFFQRSHPHPPRQVYLIGPFRLIVCVNAFQWNKETKCWAKQYYSNETDPLYRLQWSELPVSEVNLTFDGMLRSAPYASSIYRVLIERSEKCAPYITWSATETSCKRQILLPKRQLCWRYWYVIVNERFSSTSLEWWNYRTHIPLTQRIKRPHIEKSRVSSFSILFTRLFTLFFSR